MKHRFYILFGSALLFVSGIFFADTAFAKAQPETNIVPWEMLIVDTPPPTLHRIAEPTIPSRDSSTSLHPGTVEPVDHNPAETANPE